MDIKNDPEFASLTLLVYLDDITIMGPAALALRAAGYTELRLNRCVVRV